MHVPDPVYEARLAKCHDCVHWKKSGICGACGCFMSVKARAAHIGCPAGFWKRWSPEA